MTAYTELVENLKYTIITGKRASRMLNDGIYFENAFDQPNDFAALIALDYGKADLQALRAAGYRASRQLRLMTDRADWTDIARADMTPRLSHTPVYDV